MNYTTVSIKKARDNLSELVERAALAKETFLITKFGKAKALIVSASTLKQAKEKKLLLLKKTAGLWEKRKDIKSGGQWVRKIRVGQKRHEKIFS